MTWTLLVALVVVLGIALFASVARRNELARMGRQVRERERAVRQGSAEAQLRHPVVDLSRCLGCGTCVRACPEEGVLDLVHGQAMVVNGARCVGHAACERECPVGAITVTLTNLEKRRDIPVLDERLEAVGSPGLFLAGEVTAHALIKTAIDHGVAVGAEVARRTVRGPGVADDQLLDLVVVGAGPAGLACSLEAKRHGLRFVTIDQESAPSGTVAKYPRRKLVLTQPVELPLHGFLDRTTYSKEELIELWHGIAEKHELPIQSGTVFESVERGSDGIFTVSTSIGTYRARCVCLALGRRGSPRKLGVPGEEALANRGVSYCATCDGAYFRGKRVVVVGGGNNALDEGLFLTRYASEVILVHRRDTLRAELPLQRRAFAYPNVRFVWNSAVAEILGEERVTGVRLVNLVSGEASTLAADGVFPYIGHVPNTELVRGQLELDRHGFIVADARTRTSVPGVFAAGDVADPRYRQAATSAGDGVKAALEATRFLDAPEAAEASAGGEAATAHR